MNAAQMLNAERITKSLTSVFTRKSNARLGRPHFGSMGQIIFPLLRSKTPVRCPVGVCLGVWMVLELTDTLSDYIHSKQFLVLKQAKI